MGLSKPSDYPDKALDWYEEFDRRRRAEIKSLLTEDVIAEHAASPSGYRSFHSPKLQRVLNYFRTRPILGKYAVYASRPWKEYRIAVVSERGQPPNVLDEPVFPGEDEAAHGVFLRRVDHLRSTSE
jgi:hypothetical protein